jgi:hypothetical protein
MDAWVNHRTTKSNKIQPIDCPKCMKPVREHPRYSNFIKIQQQLIERIKFKHTLYTKKMSKSVKKLYFEIKSHLNRELYQPEFVNAILTELEYIEENLELIHVFHNFWSVYKQLDRLDAFMIAELGDDEQIEHMSYEIDSVMKSIYDDYLGQVNVVSSEMSMVDLSNGVERVKALLLYYIFTNESKFNLDLVKLENLRELKELLIDNAYRYEGETRDRAQRTIANLSKSSARLEGLNLPGEIKLEKAFDMKMTGWVKCSSGHVYSSLKGFKCPDCLSKSRAGPSRNGTRPAAQAFVDYKPKRQNRY